MTDSPRPNGPAGDEEDTFEKDLKDMLKDGPSLNDLSSTVQSGSLTGAAMPGGAHNPQGVVATSTGPPRPTSMSPPPVSSIPLSSPERNGSAPALPGQKGGQNTKLDTIRAWSINTYKCTRQMISERLGKGSKTVDLELEAQIEALRDTQRKYANILRLARALTNHFYHVVQTQRAMGDCFTDLAQKAPELQEEFTYNAETQKTLCRNGETLLGALNFFTSSVNTLCNKTMEDTIQTIRLYEQARVEYDAYRSDLETLNLGPRDSTTSMRIDEAQRKFSVHKEKYDRLRGDVSIKLKFLDENKTITMKERLHGLHQAVNNYVRNSVKMLDDLNVDPVDEVKVTPTAEGATAAEKAGDNVDDNVETTSNK